MPLPQTLTMEGWVDLMYAHADGYDRFFSYLFHMTWILIGAFTIIQLALASLSNAFLEAKEDAKLAIQREALHDQALLSQSEQVADKQNVLSTRRNHDPNPQFSDPPPEPGHTAAHFNASLLHLSEIAAREHSLPMHGRRDTAVKDKRHVPVLARVAGMAREVQKRIRVVVHTNAFKNGIMVCILVNTVVIFFTYHSQSTFEDNICKRRCDLTPWLPANASARCMGPLFNHSWYSDGAGGGQRLKQDAYCFLGDDGACSRHTQRAACVSAQSELPTRLGCHFFPHQSSASVHPQDTDEGDCRAGLFSAAEFTHLQGRALSLRHVCGDLVQDCPAFDQRTQKILDVVTEVFTWIFFSEMLLKILGLGALEYFHHGANRFDFFVVVVSMIELILVYTEVVSGSVLSVLRGFRVLRLLKLARSWSYMRSVLRTLRVSVVSLWPLMFVWLLFMYIFGLLGLQFLGGKFRFVKTDAPRSNFDSFFPTQLGQGAFVTVFQIISTENWNMVLYNAATAGGRENMERGGVIAVILPICVVFFGNYIIMNLFISILLQGFAEGEDEDLDDDAAAAASEDKTDKAHKASAEAQHVRMLRAFSRLLGRDVSAVAAAADDETLAAAAPERRLFADGNSAINVIKEEALEEELTIEEREQAPAVRKTVCGQEVDVHIPIHNALGFIGPESPVRLALSLLVHHRYFEYFIIVCIFVSSACLIFEEPDAWIRGSVDHCPPEGLNCSSATSPGHTVINCQRDARHPDFGRSFAPCGTAGANACCGVVASNEVLQALDVFFLAVFVVEMAMKIVADGLVLHRFAYLQSWWNRLDFCIVLVSIANVIAKSQRAGVVKALRTLRALRPLRIVKRFAYLRVIAQSFLQSLPEVGQTAMVVLLWLVFFGMIGVNFFRGRAYSCYDPQTQLFYGTSYFQPGSLYHTPPPLAGPRAVPTIIECVGAQGGGVAVWQGKSFNFDTIWSAILTLFSMMTTEGWVDVMTASMVSRCVCVCVCVCVCARARV
jgi:hypothetical protein